MTTGSFRYATAVLIAAGMAIVSSASAVQVASVAGGDNASVLLKVNGEAFTRGDLVYRELWNFQQGVTTSLPQTILNVVTMLVVAQHGRTLGYAMTDSQFQDLIKDQMASNRLASEDQWRAGIERLGVGPVSEFRREKEREMIIQHVQRTEIIDNVTVGDEEARTYYRQHNGKSASAPSAQALAEIESNAMTESRQRAWDGFTQRLRSEAALEWPIPMLTRAYEVAVSKLSMR